MKKLLCILPLILLAGCEYSYRYPCQDPANWNKEECNNEVCKAEGECTDIVLGRSPIVNFTDDQTDISKEKSYSEDCDRPQDSDFEEITYVPQKNVEKIYAKKEPRIQDDFVSPQEDFYREPMTMQEEALTLDSIVPTNEHNLAAS